ncbi:MAG TPA: hypothetical protein VF050_00580 [Moraxellaceae bacterium]
MSGRQKQILFYLAGLGLIALGIACDSKLLVALLILGAAGLFMLGDSAAPKKAREAQPASEPYVSPFAVAFDAQEVRVTLNGNPREQVRWEDINAIGIRIDEDFLPEPWWILFGSGKSGCMYPISAIGAKETMDEIQRRFPDLDNRAFVEAMGMMEGGKMLWSKPDPESPGAKAGESA